MTTGTRICVNSLERTRYSINYIYGFASEGFSYFLTTQMQETNTSPYISKLVRVCQDDSDYYSYTEVGTDPDDPSYSSGLFELLGGCGGEGRGRIFFFLKKFR